MDQYDSRGFELTQKPTKYCLRLIKPPPDMHIECCGVQKGNWTHLAQKEEKKKRENK